MPRERALSGAALDWGRKLCQSCQEWIEWYLGKVKRSATPMPVYGCRIGLIPRSNNGRWHCPHRKPRKPSARGGTDGN